MNQGSAWRRFCLLAILAALPALAQPRVDLVLGTATAGGGFEVYGRALVRTVAEVDPLLVVEPRSTSGSLENLALLKSGAIDLALVQGEAAHEAFTAGAAEDSPLRIVAAMYPTAGMFVVRADSPYRSIDDLKGKAVVFGARGSGLVLLARHVLDGIGLDIEKDFVPIMLERAGDGPALLRDGRVAALWGGGRGWPVFAVAMAAPSGGRFIAPDRDQIERIRTRHPFLQLQTLAPDSFPGQTEAVESVGSWSFILARQNLPDDKVYRFCRALHLGAAQFSGRLPQARDTTIANTVAALPRRELLHPGARRYLEEQGVLR
ncbi:MAG: TAXI family TRAP transporter solute-binding subunit [Rhodocyclales bacterium]|nr:TAXI family TRAP transporter solute-binding subunit [Rhodocyclales bacterium]